MNSVSHILTLLVLICFTSAIHLKKNQNVDSLKSITDAVKLYRNNSQLQAQVDRAVQNQPKYFKKFTCQNDKNYNYLILTKSQQAGSIPDSQKKQVAISCNIHARELITSEVCVDFISNISKVLSTKETKTSEETGEFNYTQIGSLLQTTRITIFYRGNDMRDTVISGKDYCIRKDKNNIDINRNFPTNFNLENLPSFSEQYPGSKPLSEPFSQCLDNYLQSINQTKNINVYIDIHTGEFSLYDSFESENNQTRPILQKMKQKYCPQCRISSQGTQNDDDIADGEIFTDVKKRFRADHSILMEIYGGYNDNLDTQQNCIAIFYPSTRKGLDYYRNIWKNALLYFVKEALKV